jgi:Ni,Fe-hydrogenase III component G
MVKSDNNMSASFSSNNAARETNVTEALRMELKEKLLDESRMSPNRPVFTIQKDSLSQALKVLVERFDARLCTITALDNGVDFELIYHVAVKELVLNIKVVVPKEESEITSVTNILPGAISLEREIWDLFQIRFQGITDSRAYIAPYEWRDDKAPLRKPIGGIVGSYQKPTVERLMQAGQVFPIPSTVINQRDELKLPPVITTTTRPEAVKEVQRIAQEVGFHKRIGFDMEKNKLRY